MADEKRKIVLIANFVYAGTGKYVSHAVENDRTLCGMYVPELLDRIGQEWEYLDEETHLNITHTFTEAGCKKCNRHLTLRYNGYQRDA